MATRAKKIGNRALYWLLWLAVPVAAAVVFMPGLVRIDRAPKGLAESVADASTTTALAESVVAMSTPIAESITGKAPKAPASPNSPVSPVSPVAAPAPAPAATSELAWPTDLPPGSLASSERGLDCLIEPYEIVEVGSPVAGLIQAIEVEHAARIEEGDVLLELDSSVERAVVELAEARASASGEIDARGALLELQRKKNARAQKLFEQDALSLELREELATEEDVARRELQRAREDRQIASLELEHARRLLERRTIRSPISGVVIERMMAPGERVDEDPILRLAQLDPLRVEVVLPSARFGSVELGDRAVVTPEFGDGKVHVARVAIVDPVVDAASGTFRVRLDLPNPEGSIPGGLHCQVRFLQE